MEDFRRRLCGLAPPARPASCASLSRVCLDAEQMFLHGANAAAELSAAARVLRDAPNLYDVKATGGFQSSHNMVQLAHGAALRRYVQFRPAPTARCAGGRAAAGN